MRYAPEVNYTAIKIYFGKDEVQAQGIWVFKYHVELISESFIYSYNQSFVIKWIE